MLRAPQRLQFSLRTILWVIFTVSVWMAIGISIKSQFTAIASIHPVAILAHVAILLTIAALPLLLFVLERGHR